MKARASFVANYPYNPAGIYQTWNGDVGTFTNPNLKPQYPTIGKIIPHIQ